MSNKNNRMRNILFISQRHFWTMGKNKGAPSLLLAEKVWVIPDAVATVLFPKVSTLSTTDAANVTRKISSLSLGIAVLVDGGLILTGYWLIVALFGEAFSDAYLPFVILISVTVPYTLFKISAAYLSGIGKQSYVLRISAISAIVNIVLNLILLPRHGIIGAALASAISYSIGSLTAVLWTTRISTQPFASFLSFWKIRSIDISVAAMDFKK